MPDPTVPGTGAPEVEARLAEIDRDVDHETRGGSGELVWVGRELAYRRALRAALTELAAAYEDKRRTLIVAGRTEAQLQRYCGKLEVELDAARQDAARLREAGAIVNEGFETGVFVRNTDGDSQSGWAIKLLPYLQALGVLASRPATPEEGT